MKTYKVMAVHKKRYLNYKERADNAIVAMRQTLRRRPAVSLIGAIEVTDTEHKNRFGFWTKEVDGSFVSSDALIKDNEKNLNIPR